MWNRLIGTWKINPLNSESLKKYGNVSIEFKNTGELIYTIHLKFKDQKILMTYELEGDILITNQPSSPRREETIIRFLTDDELELDFDGSISQYIRV